MLRHVQQSSRQNGCHRGRCHLPSRRRGNSWKTRPSFPPSDLPNRIRHTNQHERERGDFQPCHSDTRWRSGKQNTRPPKRSLQHGSKLERLVPHGYAHCECQNGGRRDAARIEEVAGSTCEQERGVQGYREDRQDALSGCHSVDIGSGVWWVRRAGAGGHREGGESTSILAQTRPRRNRRGNRIEHREGIRCGHRGHDRRRNRVTVRDGSQ
mmetsp:Transcript_38739/g.57017  ORF Transcript_38739/g.57017 Transcript_38739/m.57017 type:complete len:211 (-) Transcript_38739:328-960(-)